MYKLLLILKYLRKRRLAWWSVLAVALCTTMVLVVLSVMGGWMEMFQDSARGLSGDIIIHGTKFLGMPYYDQIIQRMRAEIPEFEDAAPVVSSFGLVQVGAANAGGGGLQFETGVEIIGYPPNIGNVNGFADSLYRLKGSKNISFSLWPQDYFTPTGYSGPSVYQWPGLIAGQGVIGVKRNRDGSFNRDPVIYNGYVYLTVLPHEIGASALNSSNAKRAQFWIIDDSRTKVSAVDQHRVYVAFGVLQKLLLMQGSADEPARANDIQISLKNGADLIGAKDRIDRIVSQVRAEMAKQQALKAIASAVHERAEADAKAQNLDPQATERLIADRVQAAQKLEEASGRVAANERFRMAELFPYKVQTFREAHADFLSVVGTEKGLITILLGLIGLVAVFMILCVFYMVVAEKTRDIGTIKSVGASPAGVAAIFLGYGAVIGIVGSMLGWLFSFLIVHNINELHAWVGEKTGVLLYNPEFYLFDTIPSRMNPHDVALIVGIAILSSIVGALIPAIRAARMQPVEALRWE